MPYSNLQQLGFGNKFVISEDKETNKRFVESVPFKSGVYAIVADKPISRLKGKSEILYLGKTSNLRRRLKHLLKYFLPDYYVGRWGRHTARKMLKIIFEETDIKPAIVYLVHSNPRVAERKLLQGYYLTHLETPPLNNQRR